jgi:hypothetical protein
MTAMGIQQQAHEVQELIEASRSVIANGRFVNISEVEQKITRLFETVSNNPQTSLDIDVGKIAGSLATLMNELDGLESDLDAQHQGFSANSEVSPDSAAAAYQN